MTPPVIAQVSLSADSLRVVNQPPPPSNPPTLRDVTRGLHLAAELLTQHKYSGGEGDVGDNDVIQGHIYSTKLINALEFERAQPVWVADFTGTILAHMEKLLAPIKADISTIKNDIVNIENDIGEIKNVLYAMKYNIQAKKVDIEDIKDKAHDIDKIGEARINSRHL
ncbi:hypothetical protein HYPSUDRAFT_42562 [Hypholoma sublateritium FD-334 SS-4]|uniref:Uncharacterized protein n=1 Tax=Hypholoma sublateritium (strain FD-334 SS-4) TaxID=945553 RepID=A0A0D2L2L4_HYPSF|nr:hypothetical protein HYPSUDRAFT_42562 [Hypholoma sublateritium FD-334 SS-4]